MRAQVTTTTANGHTTVLITMSIDPTGVQVTQTQQGARVRLAGWPPTAGAAAPDLPARTIWVALPRGHRAVSLVDQAGKTLPLSPGPGRVAAVPPPRRDVGHPRTAAVRVARSSTQPSRLAPWARLIRTISVGETPVAVLEVRPVRWRAGQPLAVAVSLNLLLELQSDPGLPARGQSLPGRSLAQRARLAQLARCAVVNPEQVSGPAQAPRSLHNSSPTWDYLIITDDLTWDARGMTPTGQRPGMVAAFQDLAAWKAELGLRARVVTIGQIMTARTGVGLGTDFQAGAADVQATLRAFLAWAHQEWGIAYVMLGGDQHTVPIRVINNGQWVPDLPTDFYYADLDPTCHWVQGQQVDLGSVNYRCDLSVGRAPAADATQARTFVERVISYERAQLDLTGNDDPWVRRVLLAAVKWGGDEPTLVPAAGSFPPAVNTYALTAAPQGALIQLERVITVEAAPGASTNPGLNRWCHVAGTDHIKIHLGPTYKTIQGINLVSTAGTTPLPHDPQAGPTRPGWYYTDWADNDGPAHDLDGANCPTSWIIVHLAPGSSPVRFQVALSGDFRLPYNLLSNLGGGDYRPIPFSLDAATTGRGWYFARSPGDTSPSPVDPATGAQFATDWLFVRASPDELRPRHFVLDPSTEADTMTEKELLRQQLAQDAPGWDQVVRLYDDVVDLPNADPAIVPAQYYTLDRLRRSLDAGQHIISLAGHGLPTETCASGQGGNFDRGVADRLTNAPRFGILFANSCLTNRYTEDSLSRHLVLTNPNGGLVAYVGFSDSVSIGLGHAVERKFFHDLLTTGELGLAFDGRIAMMDPGSGFPAGTDVRYTTLMMTMLGDPAMRVAGAYRYWRAAHLFTAESIELARIGGFANASRNSLDPRTHLDWAATATPGHIAADLRDKHDLALHRLAGQSHADAAGHFAATVMRLASYGHGKSGWEVAGVLQAQLASDWAVRTLATPGGARVVAAEIGRLVDLALADVLAGERHLLEMIYTRESVVMAQLGGWGTSVASSDASLRPADHRSWAQASGTTLGEIRDDLIRKYDTHIDRHHALGPQQAAAFYAQACLRCNALGVDFGSTSANWQQYQLHFDWALHASRTELKDALSGRVRRIWEVLARPEAFPPQLQVRLPGLGGQSAGRKLLVGPLATGQDWLGIIELVNTGGGSATITAARLTGLPVGLATATIDQPTATPIRAAAVQLRVTAAPVGRHLGQLRITTDAPGLPLIAVDVEIAVSGAHLDIGPMALDLGAARLGTSASGRITVSNTGNASAGGLFAEITGPDAACFALPGWGDPSHGIEMTGGRTLGLDVTFTPVARGAATADLVLTATAPPRCDYRIPLAGFAVAPVIASPMSAGLDFGLVAPGSTARLALMLHNTGDADLTVSTMDLQADRFSPFAVVAPGSSLPPELPAVIGAGQQGGFEVVFWAPGPGQLRPDTLIVSSDASNTTRLLIPLTAGTAGPGLATPTEAISFGVVAVGDPQSVRDATILSSGTTPVTVLGIALDPASPAFALGGLPSLPIALPAGQQLRFQVAFDPTSPGSYRAGVVITTDDPDRPRSRISVSGTAK